MERLIFIVAIIFVVYLIGYVVGRKEVIDDIREMTKELRENDISQE